MQNKIENLAKDQACAQYEALATMVEMLYDAYWTEFEELTEKEEAHDDAHGE